MHPLIATPATLALIYRAYCHSSLTTPGILLAALTATVHALHPSPLPFTLLVLFFLLGTSATKIKKEVKANLTLSSTGHRSRSSSGRVEDWFGGGWNKHKPDEKVGPAGTATPNGLVGQEPRGAIQVLANSGVASLLCVLHVWFFGTGTPTLLVNGLPVAGTCFGDNTLRDLLLVGIISNYAAVTADTLSSELGILSSVRPRFILSLQECPPGTNGGITGTGLFAGLGGAFIIGLVSVLSLPDIWNWDVCSITSENRAGDLGGMVLAVGGWGALGSLLDSLLGAALQASVVDRRSGKVVEAHGGGRVLVSSSSSSSGMSSVTRETRAEKVKRTGTDKEAEKEKEKEGSRVLGSGRDILDNNQVNFLMATLMSVGGMALAAAAWEVPVSSLWGVR